MGPIHVNISVGRKRGLLLVKGRRMIVELFAKTPYCDVDFDIEFYVIMALFCVFRQSTSIEIVKYNTTMEQMKYNEGVVLVRVIPGDGHCLFAALVNQYHRYDIREQCHADEIINLRRTVVNHIRNNDDRYQPCLRQLITEAGLSRGKDTERAIQEFLHRLEHEREWGGEESIAATSEVFNCRIDVYHEEGPIIKYNEPGVVNRTLRIAYRIAGSRSRNVMRNHYDSVVQILKNRVQNNDCVMLPDNSENDYRPPLPQVHAWQRNNMPNESQISMRTTTSSIEPQQSQLVDTARTELKVASWNVRGCSDRAKQEALDLCFSLKGYAIIALQETRMAGCSIDTQHYHWFNVNNDTVLRDRVGGGTAVLINKNLYEQHCFKKISNNSCSFLCKVFKDPIVFISTYIRSAEVTTNNEFDNLTNYVSGLPESLRNRIIIAGDMNARLGKNDLAEDDREYIGRNLYHNDCNANGIELKTMLHCLKMRNYISLSRSKSVNYTWANRITSSQIDHILMSRMKDLLFPDVKAFFHPTLISDHKLLECMLKTKRQSNNNEQQTRSAPHPTKKFKLDIDRLKTDEKCRDRFHKELDQRLRVINEAETDTIDKRWEQMSEALHTAATMTIGPKTSPQTPRRAAASKRYFLARQKLLEDRDNGELKRERAFARKLKEDAEAEHFEEKVKAFLEEIQDANPLEQMTRTFRFIKAHKRGVKSKKRGYINIQKWEEKLRNSERGNMEFTRLNEEGSNAGPTPTQMEIEIILQRMKNNAAPGTDGLPAELFKYGTESLIEALLEIISKAFEENVIPTNWTWTLQVPIPKINNPLKVDDYRCITLCNIAYKIYACILLNRLKNQLPAMLSYQMAFQESRSASDQLFVLRRIIDERWRKGCPTILVSIDLKQAFDTIEVSKLAPILQQMGVSPALINRIVEACLVEVTSLQWYGQRTPTISKGKGIKQGCPLSPRLFILMLHHVLMTLKEFVPEMNFEHIGRIILPCILAYADDILILCENEEDVGKLIEILEPLLASVGLQINTTKTKVLFRNPYDIKNTAPDCTKQFGKYNLAVVTKLRYLGAFITSSLTRKEITAERIKKAKKAFHALCSFLRKYKLKWEVVKRLYHTLITPVVTYSMEVSTILKRNRNDLRTMEREMLITLMSLSKDKDCLASTTTETATVEDLEEAERRGITENEQPSTETATTEGEHVEGEERRELTEEEEPFAPAKILEGHTINNKIRVARLKFYGHVIRNGYEGILRTALRYRLPKKKKIGRPAFTWRTSIRQDIERSGIPQEVWQEWAHDKTVMDSETKKLFTSLRESDDDSNSEQDDNTEDELLSSEFEGFSSDDSSISEGIPHQ